MPNWTRDAKQAMDSNHVLFMILLHLGISSSAPASVWSFQIQLLRSLKRRYSLESECVSACLRNEMWWWYGLKARYWQSQVVLECSLTGANLVLQLRNLLVLRVDFVLQTSDRAGQFCTVTSIKRFPFSTLRGKLWEKKYEKGWCWP